MKTILLFTEVFPLGDNSEHAFLKDELKILNSEFDRVIVFPSLIYDKVIDYDYVSYDNSLAKGLAQNNRMKIVLDSLFDKYFYKEIIEKPSILFQFKKIKRLIVFIGRKNKIQRWASSYLKSFLNKDTIIYTFWTNEITLALATLAPDIKVISRAHGHDLYEEYEGYYGYLPCYKFILNKIDRQILVSQPAIDYLSKKFPKSIPKLRKYHLGVSEAKSLSNASTDDKIRIVSCSFVIKRKRVDFILKGIQKYVDIYKEKIQWTHFGDGDEFEELKEKIKNTDSSKLKIDLKGYTSNYEIIKYYQENNVDVFILTTELEGGVPVSIQEAQAHGIPVIATAVGGIPEIVSPKVGILLPTNPSNVEISSAINQIVCDKAKHYRMRKESLLNWKNNFNSNVNYHNFVKELHCLLTD